MGVPYSCRVSQEEYGADDDDEILRGIGTGLKYHLSDGTTVAHPEGVYEAHEHSLRFRRIV